MKSIQSTVRPDNRPSLQDWVNEFRVGTNVPPPRCQRAEELNLQYTKPTEFSWKNILHKLLLGIN